MNKDYSSLNPEEKRTNLFIRQKNTLDLFLERNAISQEQYDKSLSKMKESMGVETFLNKGDNNDDKS